MRLPGDRAHAVPLTRTRDAALVLRDARGRELAGCLPEAIEGYQAAIVAAERSAAQEVRVEALRRLAVARYRMNEREPARTLCRRSYQDAIEMGDRLLAAEALNALGGMELSGGSLVDARRNFLGALELAGSDPPLGARVEQASPAG